MKRLVVCIALGIGAALSLSLSAMADDCPGGNWNVLPNYVPGHGYPCQLLGLDTHRGTCQPGYQFETLCDDASGGRYKVCQGPRRCNAGNNYGPPPNVNCQQWDFDHNRQCPPGFENRNCQGGCSRVRQNGPPPNVNCQQWDFDHNRQCPPGFENRNCKGGCSRIKQAPPQPPAPSPPPQQNCQNWDYDRNQPCPPGYINRDCHGGCGRR